MFDNDGGVDKFVGDEIVAFFFPLMSGPNGTPNGCRQRRARRCSAATGHDDPEGPWVPVGVGVSSGMAWVGAVGDEKRTDLTALGDNVNIAARLGALARAGEALITVEAAEAAGLDAVPAAEAASTSKASQMPTDVVSLIVGKVPVAAP